MYIHIHTYLLEIMNFHWYLLTGLFLAFPFHVCMPLLPQGESWPRSIAVHLLNPVLHLKQFIVSKMVSWLFPTSLQTADLLKRIQDLFVILSPRHHISVPSWGYVASNIIVFHLVKLVFYFFFQCGYSTYLKYTWFHCFSLRSVLSCLLSILVDLIYIWICGIYPYFQTIQKGMCSEKYHFHLFPSNPCG